MVRSYCGDDQHLHGGGIFLGAADLPDASAEEKGGAVVMH
jgi:hypothetical protein